jgi:hypothetical protein
MDTDRIVMELRKRGYEVAKTITQHEVSDLVKKVNAQPQHQAAETNVVMHLLSDLLRNSLVQELCKETTKCQQQC